jgi:hypothetical protein
MFIFQQAKSEFNCENLRRNKMGFDQQGSSVFCVARGASGQWEVSEEGFDKPLASFETAEDASSYARDMSKLKQDSSVKIFDDQGIQMPDE